MLRLCRLEPLIGERCSKCMAQVILRKAISLEKKKNRGKGKDLLIKSLHDHAPEVCALRHLKCSCFYSGRHLAGTRARSTSERRGATSHSPHPRANTGPNATPVPVLSLTRSLGGLAAKMRSPGPRSATPSA